MPFVSSKMTFAAAALLAGTVFFGARLSGAEIVSRTTLSEAPPWYNAVYVEKTGTVMRGGSHLSELSTDNGKTWQRSPMTPDYLEGLPYGFRRETPMAACDPDSGRFVGVLNALDTEGLDPSIVEPEEGQELYYLRFRVSLDGGKTWAYDEPMTGGDGYTKGRPFDDMIIGRNSFYLGDKGSIPFFTKGGKLLIPAQMTVLSDDPNGKWYRPNNILSWTDAIFLIGTWNAEKEKYQWERSQRIRIDLARSTRGMIEPTLYEAPDGRLLAVMRGSNGGGGDPNCEIPSYRWYSISEDGGYHWSDPQPWTYDTGEKFFSPSSMSVLFRHSSGRGFWIGNISESNCRGNDPRHPLMFGEVDPETLQLKKDSIITIDKIEEADKDRLPLACCHSGVYEDRQTGELVITYVRGYNGYKTREYVTVRIDVNK